MKLADILKNRIAEDEAEAMITKNLKEQEAIEMRVKHEADTLAQYPAFQQFITDYIQTIYKDRKLVIDSRQRYFNRIKDVNGKYVYFYIDSLLKMKFEDIRNFGIANGFQVLTEKNVVIDYDCDYDHDGGPVRGSEVDVYGPRITFNW